MTVDVYDDVLESHVREFIDISIRDLSWKYEYPSNAVSYTHLTLPTIYSV